MIRITNPTMKLLSITDKLCHLLNFSDLSVWLAQITGIFAPLPTSDVIESPIELNATTRISTEAELAKFHPGFLRVDTGIVQVVAEMIVLSVVASQFVES